MSRGGRRPLHWANWLAALALLLAACQATATPEPALSVTSVRVFPGDSIYVDGRSLLPEDTCIITQLLRDGDSVADWPSAVCSYALGQSWQVKVLLKENGGVQSEIPTLENGVKYTLVAAPRDNPELKSAPYEFEIALP